MSPATAAQRVVRAFTLAAGWGLVALSFLIVVEVLGRKFFSFSVQGADELGGYALAFATSIGFSHALVDRAHIRIDLLQKRLPAPAQALLNAAAFLLLMGFAGLLAWRAVAVFLESIRLNAHAQTPLGTPLAVPQAVWAAGILVFAGLAVGAVIGVLGHIARGRFDAAARDYASASEQSEIDAEIAAARERTDSGGHA